MSESRFSEGDKVEVVDQADHSIPHNFSGWDGVVESVGGDAFYPISVNLDNKSAARNFKGTELELVEDDPEFSEGDIVYGTKSGRRGTVVSLCGGYSNQILVDFDGGFSHVRKKYLELEDNWSDDETPSESELVEKLASLEHDQWRYWTAKLSLREDLPQSVQDRWNENWEPYEELPEGVKSHDRRWAEKVVELLENEGILSEAQ